MKKCLEKGTTLVFSSISPGKVIDINNLTVYPYADGNKRLWENTYEIQYPESEIEIIACDSSLILFSTTQSEIANHFSTYFHEAKILYDYNTK